MSKNEVKTASSATKELPAIVYKAYSLGVARLLKDLRSEMVLSAEEDDQDTIHRAFQDMSDLAQYGLEISPLVRLKETLAPDSFDRLLNLDKAMRKVANRFPKKKVVSDEEE